jgi:hypothetical protein
MDDAFGALGAQCGNRLPGACGNGGFAIRPHARPRHLIPSIRPFFRGRSRTGIRGGHMAKSKKETVYKIVDVVGVSEKSWEDAGRNAVAAAAGSLRDLRVAEVTKMDMKVEQGKIVAFRTRVSLSFKYEA